MGVVKVRDLMTHPAECLEEYDELELAEMIMRLDRIRHLPVINAGQVVGLVTHRDVLKAQGQGKKALTRLRVGEIMTDTIRTISADAPAREAAIALFEHKIGCLPVTDDQELVGIITDTDFLKLAIRHLSDPS